MSLGDGSHTERMLGQMDKGGVDGVDATMTSDFTRPREVETPGRSWANAARGRGPGPLGNTTPPRSTSRGSTAIPYQPDGLPGKIKRTIKDYIKKLESMKECATGSISNISKDQNRELKSRPSCYLSELILHINAGKPSIRGANIHMKRK